MEHVVKTFNKAGKCLYESHHKSAGKAYEEYMYIIRILRRHVGENGEITVARFNDGYVMAVETISGEE